jgi:hypothetical protein
MKQAPQNVLPLTQQRGVISLLQPVFSWLSVQPFFLWQQPFSGMFPHPGAWISLFCFTHTTKKKFIIQKHVRGCNFRICEHAKNIQGS